MLFLLMHMNANFLLLITVTTLLTIKYVLHCFSVLIYFIIFVLATAGWSPTLH